MTKILGKHKLRRPRYRTRLKTLFKTPTFWILTLTGNLVILLGAIFLFHFESQNGNTQIQFIDSLVWSTSLTTTIGSGNYVATTTFGKITVLLLMLIGTLFVWSYMAFLATALIAPELYVLERELQQFENDLSLLKSDEKKD